MKYTSNTHFTCWKFMRIRSGTYITRISPDAIMNVWPLWLSIHQHHWQPVRKPCVKSKRYARERCVKMVENITASPPPLNYNLYWRFCCCTSTIWSCISYHFAVHCVWIAEAYFPDSSTAPMRTGVCTLVFHSALPAGHCWHRSGKPLEEQERSRY